MTFNKSLIAPIIAGTVGLIVGGCVGAFLMRRHDTKEVEEKMSEELDNLNYLLHLYVPRAVFDKKSKEELAKEFKGEDIVFVYEPVMIRGTPEKETEVSSSEEDRDRWRRFVEKRYPHDLTDEEMSQLVDNLMEAFAGHGSGPIPASEIERVLAEYEHPTEEDLAEYEARRLTYGSDITEVTDLYVTHEGEEPERHDPDVDGCGVDTDEGDPYLIDESEYHETKRHYDKIFLTYYEEDNVLCDDQDEIVQDVDNIIGYQNIDTGFADPKTKYIYVRSPDVSTDWEIFRHEGSYVECVLGVPSDDAPKIIRRRFDDDD